MSACQTGVGDDRAALGLAGVALKAGARSALATLWFINDEASAPLISEFYRQLRNPALSKAVALQRAQLKLLSERIYEHPAYWSPFLLLNNWLCEEGEITMKYGVILGLGLLLTVSGMHILIAADKAPSAKAGHQDDLIYTPPKKPTPRARVGGTLRGTEGNEPELVALVPDHVGMTVKQTPTLNWYLSKPTTYPCGSHSTTPKKFDQSMKVPSLLQWRQESNPSISRAWDLHWNRMSNTVGLYRPAPIQSLPPEISSPVE